MSRRRERKEKRMPERERRSGDERRNKGPKRGEVALSKSQSKE